jgi:hypothetical protein
MREVRENDVMPIYIITYRTTFAGDGRSELASTMKAAVQEEPTVVDHDGQQRLDNPCGPQVGLPAWIGR